MQMTAKEWSDYLGGLLEGDPNVLITHPAKIEEADEGSISFIGNQKYTHFASSTKASALLVDYHFQQNDDLPLTLIRVDQPHAAFAKVLEKFKSEEEFNGIENFAFVDPSAQIGQNVYAGAFSYISKNAVIGNNVKIFPGTFVGESASINDHTILFPGVTIYKNCMIGKNCIIHSGVVIGSDGFGFAPNDDGTYTKVPQLGNVVIEDNVEIGSNTTIDRATMGSTLIRKGVKLDNLIQIAHNVEIGENTVMAAQSGVSGSTKIGKNCQIGGQVGFVGHLHIAEGSRFGAKSGVGRSITDAYKAWNGIPAFEYTASLRTHALLRKLPQLEQRIADLEKMLQQAETK